MHFQTYHFKPYNHKYFSGNERPSLLPSSMPRALQSLRLAPAKSDRTRTAPSVVKVDFQEFDPDHYKAIALEMGFTL